MMLLYPNGNVEVTVPATESISVFTLGDAKVYRKLTFPNYPPALSYLGTVSAGQTVFGAYATGATIVIEAGASHVQYCVGVSPSCPGILQTKIQAAPGVLNATGALTAAMMLAGIVTSTTAADVVATVPTGTVMDSAVEFAVGDSFDWSVINLGAGANSGTLTASSNHTIVGAAVVAAATSAMLRTRKTAADTFITYRIS